MTPIHGNTYPVKDQLRALGGQWDAEQKCWLVPDDKAHQANLIVSAAPKPKCAKCGSSLVFGKHCGYCDRPRTNSRYTRPY